jgi:D-arabinose 1-dehydrogenase-like Zn-dependent alcohol dehydrogenase
MVIGVLTSSTLNGFPSSTNSSTHALDTPTGAPRLLVSTIYAADEGWFAERKITTHNIASISNPLSSPQGLKEVARMLADGTITARIRSTVELEAAGQMLDKLRHGALRGKGVIRF